MAKSPSIVFQAGDRQFVGYRNNIKGKAYMRIYEKGKPGMTAQVRAKRSNKDTVVDVEKKLKEKGIERSFRLPKKGEVTGIFRSSIVMGYRDRKTGITPFEYRVWIHTKDKKITEADLERWMDNLKNLFPISDTSVFTPLGMEINEEIDEDEVTPDEYDTYFGVALFFTRNKQYYAKQVGSRFSETRPFSFPKRL